MEGKQSLLVKSSKLGFGYLLFQPGDEETKEFKEEEPEETKRKKKPLGRNIVSMGATGLTPGQHKWSIFEIELLAVCLVLDHARYYCLKAPRNIIHTDLHMAAYIKITCYSLSIYN